MTQRERIEELEAENAKLREQVAGLICTVGDLVAKAAPVYPYYVPYAPPAQPWQPVLTPWITYSTIVDNNTTPDLVQKQPLFSSAALPEGVMVGSTV